MYDIKYFFQFETRARQLHETPNVDWSSLIFVQFHPAFEFFVQFSVIIKSILGPIQAVYPIVYCSDAMDLNPCLLFIKYWYWYGCDTIYGIDTFLHIVHRQVTDKAMRKEYLPKSAFFILLDLLSLVPLFRLVAMDNCPAPKVWPNIFAFNEVLIIYRLVDYFALTITHSFWKMLVGYTIILGVCLNCVNCYWLLLTHQGLCDRCESGIYDWRSHVQHKLNESDSNYTTYVYAFTYIVGFVINKSYDAIKPHTILEFQMVSIFIVCGYLAGLFIVFPKGFGEAILRLRMICERYPDVKKIIEDTRRRTTSDKSYKYVENFYVLMWKKRSGITSVPEAMADLPRYLRLEIRQDLVWQFFYHSPTLRNTSNPFKRWLCECIKLEYKLPGERLYTGIRCHTNLYYIKNGVVQLISNDDGTTPILSLTGGTILGDVNFLVPPPARKKITMRCLTYCEILHLDRKDLLKALYRYPTDRELIMKLTNVRLEHAKTLDSCKQRILGIQKEEDQGISWIIRRWWEIYTYVHSSRYKSDNSCEYLKCDIPPEETSYHCAKYIGQLVLCNVEQLQTKSMFANIKFPWILTPDSVFVDVWHRIVLTTVFIVLIAYPPNLTTSEIPKWFEFIQYWTNFIYAADICVSLLTCLPGQEHDAVDFSTVMFARFKSFKFILDVLSAIWTEKIAVIIGIPNYYYTVQFNRLLKTHIIFYGDYLKMDIRKKPIVNINYVIILVNFVIMYFSSYIVYEIYKHYPEITTNYFFGARYCETELPQEECDPGLGSVFGVFVSWIFELVFWENYSRVLVDIYIALCIDYFSYFIYVYCKAKLVVCLYLKYRDVVSYQHFVSNLKNHYINHKIHPDLLKRLERYLVCHWKYYKGKDVMDPNMIKTEPYEVYWKAEGEVAEKIISESKAFIGANPALIRELAYAAQFMILPCNASIFTFGAPCRIVTWIVQGCIKCEYHDEEGELLKMYYDPGRMLSMSAVYFGTASLRTYTSYTDCEILYIKVKDFFNIIKRHPTEWSYYKTCMQEFRGEYEEMFPAYVLKHRNYQRKLRSKHSSKSSTIEDEYRSSPLEGEFWGYPNNEFMKKWLLFRAITVVISITSSSIQGSIGATNRWPFIMLCSFCDCIAFIDITLKLFLGYYNNKGLLITDKRLCLMHYLSRGFVPDVIGAAPLKQIFRAGLTQGFNDDVGMLFTTFCKFAHLYIVAEYFNYISDTPVVNKSWIMIIKWQVLNVMVMIGASQFLMVYCIDITFDSSWNAVSMQRLNTCWVPKFLKIDNELTFEQMHLLFIESFNLVQSGYMISNIGKFHIDRDDVAVGCCLLCLGIFWWYITCYTLTLLVLSFRGNTLLQNELRQLKRFLEGERVEKKLIHRAVSYFRYKWMRAKGVNMHPLTSERIGFVFRQDLSFYFYRNTFMALDTILDGGEALVRQLASASAQVYYLPGQEILRAMDVSRVVFIVHRGSVIITKEGERVINLGKGCIFGQLEGTQTRPIRISVTADEYVDLLQIPIKQFQEIINDKVRKNIAISSQAKFDFMATRKAFLENPHETIQYILRGRKATKLPWMSLPVAARRKTWYIKWLFVAWFVEPFSSSIIVIFLGTLPPDYMYQFYWVLGVLDITHLCNFVAEFYTITIDVEHNRCVERIVGTRRFKQWGTYVDAASLLSPLLTIFTHDWKWQLARLLRLRLLYDFHVHFCRSFKSNAASMLMTVMILCLLFHGFTCGWIYVACRNEKFPIPMPNINEAINKSIDYDQWVLPTMRQGGCPRLGMNSIREDGVTIPTFVVAKHWKNDYIVALMYVLIIQRNLALESIVCLSTKEVYYKVIMTFFINLIDIFIMSIAINAMYAKFRELYYYDYNVINLIKYLKHNGLSPILSDAALKYTKQFWMRQKGNWLPELVNLTPDCLREDLFDSLYMYHLDVPSMYRNIPIYFKRQMVARLKRVVVFPGKCIIREGDIYGCTYFIHEGEVEKWFADDNGDDKFHSLLYTNGYFGIVPGVIPVPYEFSYYTRTVVDMVYLKLADWQDLLDSYPDVKQELLSSAYEYRRQLLKQRYGKIFSSQGNKDPDLYTDQPINEP